MHRRAFLGLMTIGTVSAIADIKSHNNIDNNIWLKKENLAPFLYACKRVELVEKYVGHGNFNILTYDDMLSTAKRYPKIGEFTSKELNFMEELFYTNPNKYGFYGKKTVSSITSSIDKKKVMKIPNTGHYLFRGHSKKLFNRAISDVGQTLILTSGVRGVPKQMNLYLNKIKSTKGDITLASNSIAPPGYSYHSIGDFDVGKKGWGYKNFTTSFMRTKEFWKLKQLSYISMRYTVNNQDGVRFEPWHIKTI
ncbi:MAG: D-alanyl-D-alanine carboxypeptidase family protein [Sulfurospirillum sp.]|nr:D-alanyl-D-alanine carboxypeptidase family protein [Sulfurospirillum sp.]